MDKQTLRLFNAIQVESVKSDFYCTERTIKNGYVVVGFTPTEKQLSVIDSVVGLSGEKMNSSFHKSWSVVKDSPIEVLFIQQVFHYFTTYGFELLGIDSGFVYIPNEVLEIPQLESDIKLAVVKGFTKQEIYKKVVSLSSSGIALSKETIEDIIVIVKANKYEQEFVKSVSNKELRSLLYDYYGLVPDNPVEYLRYVISKTTGKSLLIKDIATIDALKSVNWRELDLLLEKAPSNLSSIFFRFKPLFLAMKSASRNKTFFNRLRKQAEKTHKPLEQDYLNSITFHIKKNDFNANRFEEELKRVNVFRKVRLANALMFRLSGCDSVIYSVRNGRGWATEFEWNEYGNPYIYNALEILKESISNDVKTGGKKFYIPSAVSYPIPTSEKQFVGNLPIGTCVTVPTNIIFGVYWENTEKRVDLDLAMISISGKTGWDYRYRDGDRILFSGDMTDARNGASEVFYSKKNNTSNLITLNYYNQYDKDTVDARIFVAHEKTDNLCKNYMVNPNNVIATTTITVSEKQNYIGLIDGERFYFGNVSVGNSITSSNDEKSRRSREYMLHSLRNKITFRDVLGSSVTEAKEDGCIDLSPERLDKTTLIDLIS